MRATVAFQEEAVPRTQRAGSRWDGLRAWWARWDERRRHRATVRILSALDDRTLHDIGIDRSEIGSIARPRDETRRRQRYVEVCRRGE